MINIAVNAQSIPVRLWHVHCFQAGVDSRSLSPSYQKAECVFAVGSLAVLQANKLWMHHWVVYLRIFRMNCFSTGRGLLYCCVK